MTRYKIWNKTDTIYTPSGEEFTSEQWLDRYKWAKAPGAKMIITDGAINGGVAMEFNATVAHYQKQGCELDPATMSDEEILAAIEEFEDTPPEMPVDTTERMVALEEYKAMIEVEGYQAPVEIVEQNFKRGLWTKGMVDLAETYGSITKSEKEAIIGKVPGGKE